MADTPEQLAIRKVAWRLLPFLFLMFIWCLIDRVNLAFAALTMNTDLGFTATMYSLGASIFFLGYCTFKVPSNLLLERYGARVWLARIMITWGIAWRRRGRHSGPCRRCSSAVPEPPPESRLSTRWAIWASVG